jgi:uncharacterized delta-60 repeat protein
MGWVHNRRPVNARVSPHWTVAILVYAYVSGATGAYAQTLDDFEPGSDDAIYSIVVQPDQRILVGGAFTTLGGGDTGETPRQKIGRLNPDGSIDTTFNPSTSVGSNGQVRALAVQPDGKVLVAGVDIANGRNIIRLNADGSIDTAFTGAVNGPVFALALQPNGQIVIGGGFSAVNGGVVVRRGIARLQADGSADLGFNPGTNGTVRALALQDDGRILVGGTFTMLGGGGTGTTSRHNIGRLHPNGSIDTTFDAGVGSFTFLTTVSAIALQPDQKILVGGRFSTLGDGGSGFSSRYNLGRVTQSGSLDTTFAPALIPPSDGCCESNGSVESILVLPNRDVLVGGEELAFGNDGETLLNLVRLDDRGTQYFDFTPYADWTINAITPQLDGKVLLGGRFWWEDFDLRRHLVRIDVTSFPAVKLVGTSAVSFAWQGAAVAISADGNTAIVGGPQDQFSRGAAWVWTRTVRILGTPGLPQVVWAQQGPKLVGLGAQGSVVQQGAAVALSADGNTAVVGGPNDNDGLGAAWIWTRNGGEWTPQGPKLVGPGAIGSTVGQGAAVAISADGNTVLIGAPYDDTGVGAVWVWTRTGTSWTPGPKLIAAGAVGPAWQGISVALSADGNTAVVGGRADDNWMGAAWVWRRSGQGWTQDGPKLVGSGGIGPFVEQGSSVSVSGDGQTVLVGAFADNNFTGAAWVWTRGAAAWIQQGPKLVGWRALSGSSVGGYQGLSVSLSTDGNRAVVGGRNDDLQTGAAWLWTRRNGVWSARGPKLVAPTAIGAAEQGSSVGMSGDGSIVIVGGPFDDGTVGAAWIFSAPSVITQVPTVVTTNSAVLNALATSNAGSATRTFASFEYGTTNTYGNTVWVTQQVPSGITPASASASIFGLACGTRYHVRAVAAGAVTTQGSDVAFTTAPCAPAITTITPGNRQLTVAFTPASGGGVPITNYQYSLDGATTWIVRSPAATTSPLVIANLTNGTAYRVSLRAVNSVGEGVPSLLASATPSSVPDAPSIEYL